MTDLLELLGRVGTALVSDGLDVFGIAGKVIAPHIRQLTPSRGFVGRARTILLEPNDSFVQPPRVTEIEQKTIERIERLEAMIQPGDVIVSGFTRPAPPIGIVGELFSTLYKQLGVQALVTEGYVRDVQAVSDLGFTLVASGTTPLNGAGRQTVRGVQQPVTVGHVVVANGDFIVGDADGTVVVPQDAPLAELCEWLREHDERDRKTLELIGETGRLSSAYRKLGRI